LIASAPSVRCATRASIRDDAPRSSRSRSGSRLRPPHSLRSPLRDLRSQKMGPCPRVCSGVGRAITLAAPAKINLALAITGKRADGYHDLRSVFARLDLADEVDVAPHRRLEVRNTMTVEGE